LNAQHTHVYVSFFPFFFTHAHFFWNVPVLWYLPKTRADITRRGVPVIFGRDQKFRNLWTLFSHVYTIQVLWKMLLRMRRIKKGGAPVEDAVEDAADK
jgi:hypothetical protein